MLTPDGLYLDVLVESVREVWGHELTDESFARAEHRPGETAMQGLRHLLLGEGLDRAAIDAALARWCSVFSEHYVPLLERTPTPHWRAAPGAAETLGELVLTHDLALLTGNPEPVARARLARLGLDGFFGAGTGAFGCEAEERAQLVRLARRRPATRPWRRSPSSATRRATSRAPTPRGSARSRSRPGGTAPRSSPLRTTCSALWRSSQAPSGSPLHPNRGGRGLVATIPPRA